MFLHHFSHIGISLISQQIIILDPLSHLYLTLSQYVLSPLKSFLYLYLRLFHITFFSLSNTPLHHLIPLNDKSLFTTHRPVLPPPRPQWVGRRGEGREVVQSTVDTAWGMPIVIMWMKKVDRKTESSRDKQERILLLVDFPTPSFINHCEKRCSVPQLKPDHIAITSHAPPSESLDTHSDPHQSTHVSRYAAVRASAASAGRVWGCGERGGRRGRRDGEDARRHTTPRRASERAVGCTLFLSHSLCFPLCVFLCVISLYFTLFVSLFVNIHLYV